MSPSLLPLDPGQHQRHPLHLDRIWPQTNCAFDAWVEVLHALGREPLAAAAFVVTADFEGDQWEMFKFPPEDLEQTYGITVHEMDSWRGLDEHLAEQLARGRLMTIEVDSWFLPDTHGTAYRTEHVKSGIVPNLVEPSLRRLGYFHNDGYFELEGDDYDGALRLRSYADPAQLPPYVEIVRLDGLPGVPDDELAAHSIALLRRHLARRPADNPVRRMAARVDELLGWVRAATPEQVHRFAFATVRECGACAEVAASYCRWLADRDPSLPGLGAAAEHFQLVAETAKSLPMRIARLARGRNSSLDDAFATMAEAWESAQRALDACLEA